jgi:hypothetical protein
MTDKERGHSQSATGSQVAMQMNAAVPSWHRRLSKKPDGRPVTGVLERDRLGRRLVGEIRRDRAPVADEGDELRHRRSDAVAKVRLVNIHGRGPGAAARPAARARRGFGPARESGRQGRGRSPRRRWWQRDPRVPSPAPRSPDAGRRRARLGWIRWCRRSSAALHAARVIGDDRAVGECPARVANPAAPIGDPISIRIGSVLDSFFRMS